jgi:hypothetical protein
VTRESDLFEVVGTLHARGGLAHLLHGRQQQADEDRNDRDHHQQLDQRKRTTRLEWSHDDTPEKG